MVFNFEKQFGAPHNCFGHWTPLNQWLFQVAHTALLISYTAPNNIYGVLFLHGTLIIGFLGLSIWAFVVVCAPDIFGWNFAFLIVNIVQVSIVALKLRPRRFEPELEDVYEKMFRPLNVPRWQYAQLVAPHRCCILGMAEGDFYARQDLTKADRLAVIISGSANVLVDGRVLHAVTEKEFLDSPEFESTPHKDNTFNVSVVASTPTRYLVWQRSVLEKLFKNEPYLATVVGCLIGRDVTNKLYYVSDKVQQATGSGFSRMDIRLGSLAGSRGRLERGLSLSDSDKPKQDEGKVFSVADDARKRLAMMQ